MSEYRGVRLLYVGDLRPGGTSLMRFNAFRALGFVVEALDPASVAVWGVPANFAVRAAWQIGNGPFFAAVRRSLVALSKRFVPDLVWVDKGWAITAEAIQETKASVPGVKVISYNPDDPFGALSQRGWRHFVDSIYCYDALFVPRAINVMEYQACGGGQVFHHVPFWGFDPACHRPWSVADRDSFDVKADVCFLGAFEQERAKSLVAIGLAGIRVLLSHEWPAARCWHPNFQKANAGLWGEQYGKAISGCHISLGFLRRVNRDKHTSRSIEIPACGALLVAERTDEHQGLFEEDKEAVFFSDDDELVQKTKYYLKDHDARISIARRGLQRCLKSGYDYRTVLARMVKSAGLV